MSFIGDSPKVQRLKANPQSADPSNPVQGDLQYADGTVRTEGVWQYDGSNWIQPGIDYSEGINYIFPNHDAEVNTTGWATYADAAGATPVDGTGGSPTTTWTRSTSSPLRGAASYLLTKDAANRQGEGASYDFTIDTADQSASMTIKLDAEVSANYTSGDLTVYIYDKDASSLITPASVAITGDGQFSTTFTTTASATNYRLIFHIATTNALAYTVKIDNVQVGVRPSLTSVAPNSAIRLEAAAGYGSTNTFVPYFTNTVLDTSGANMTLVNNSTSGTTVTIDVAGVYAITFTYGFTSSTGFGISLNGSGSSALSVLSNTARLCEEEAETGNRLDSCSITLPLAVNDVIKPHVETANTAASRCSFAITRVG